MPGEVSKAKTGKYQEPKRRGTAPKSRPKVTKRKNQNAKRPGQNPR